MPFKESRIYRPAYPLWRNGHLNTIAPHLIGKLGLPIVYQRHCLKAFDGENLSLDFSAAQNASQKSVLICPGLESDSQGPNELGLLKTFNEAGWDAFILNHRGCGGSSNQTIRSYHSGATEDLETALEYICELTRYEKVFLIGLSLGGNQVLRFLGLKGAQLKPKLKRAMAISVPCNLQASAERLAQPENSLYMKRFLSKLHHKAKLKQKQILKLGQALPFDLCKVLKSRNFLEFDEHFTAPLHGFKGAHDYYTQSSSLAYIPQIKIPTLLLNSRDDPFLKEACHPIAQAESNAQFFFELENLGGHVGFMHKLGQSRHHEARALLFASESLFQS